MQPRVRLTEFEAGGSNQVRIFARKNAVLSTQQFIEQTVSGEAFRTVERGYDFDHNLIPEDVSPYGGFQPHNIEKFISQFKI